MTFIADDEYIYVKPNSISIEVCDELIRLFENDLSEFVLPGVTSNNTLSDHKRTLDLPLQQESNPYDERLFTELHMNITSYFDIIRNKYGSQMIALSNMSDRGFHIQKYKCGEGYYKYHNDFSYSKPGHQMRLITFIWYLNTVEEGGETEFFNGRIKIKPEKGKLLLFPATWTYLHRGIMPISSDKYILTGWLYVNSW